MSLSPQIARSSIALSLLLLLAAFIQSVAAIPPGNNGTIKIHEGSTEAEPIVRNEPHVCTFHLHFFFADPSQDGSWWIERWPPSSPTGTVLTGTYDTSPSGEDRTPDSGAYALPDGHYKLFWQGRNEQNVKHKVFWVQCPSPSPTASPSPSPTASPSPSPTATATATATSTATATATAPASPGESSTSTPGSSPTGEVLSGGATPPPTDSGPSGSSSLPGRALPLGLLAAAAVAHAVALGARRVLVRPSAVVAPKR